MLIDHIHDSTHRLKIFDLLSCDDRNDLVSYSFLLLGTSLVAKYIDTVLKSIQKSDIFRSLNNIYISQWVNFRMPIDSLQSLKFKWVDIWTLEFIKMQCCLSILSISVSIKSYVKNYRDYIVLLCLAKCDFINDKYYLTWYDRLYDKEKCGLINDDHIIT